ncbi:MAG TPA: alginate lyase family protein, partial [Burkholderiales bacterium]|nr:alginate lyase family protein [Burkholderiales bacterium]
TTAVYTSASASIPNGAYGSSYINGAALVKGPVGKEGLVSLLIESSKIKIEKKLRFKYANDDWNLVQFNFAQNLTGHKNLKLSFRFYPRVKGYQRLDRVFLDVQSAAEVDLPSGVPATTTGSRNLCFASGELAAYDENMARASVVGCSSGVIVPQPIVESYKVYMPDNQTVNCRTNRANEFHTRYLNKFLETLAELADGSARDPAKPAAECAANMIAYWADQNAMANVSPHGYTQQARFDRMWIYGGIAATYLKNPHIRARATELNHDEAIRAWLQNIGEQLSAEIDVDRSDGGQNNIQFWRAFSILPTALLNQDAALLSNSRQVFAEAMDDIIDDAGLVEGDKGFLLSELKRLTRAAGYHGYADKPLLAMALYSQAYGCDFVGSSSFNKQQLTRLTRKVMQGYYEPEIFSEAIERYLDKSGVDVLQSDYRELMYLTHTLDPAISANVADFILARTGNTLSRTYGSSERDDRLGGSYLRLKESLALLRPLDPGALATHCPY